MGITYVSALWFVIFLQVSCISNCGKFTNDDWIDDCVSMYTSCARLYELTMLIMYLKKK